MRFKCEYDSKLLKKLKDFFPHLNIFCTKGENGVSDECGFFKTLGNILLAVFFIEIWYDDGTFSEKMEGKNNDK